MKHQFIQPADAQEKPTRVQLEQRLLDINAKMAALTPEAFNMPEAPQEKLRQRMQNKELALPDTEVLRQLLQEKARIAEQLDTLPHAPQVGRKPNAEFSLKAKSPKLH